MWRELAAYQAAQPWDKADTFGNGHLASVYANQPGQAYTGGAMYDVPSAPSGGGSSGAGALGQLGGLALSTYPIWKDSVASLFGDGASLASDIFSAGNAASTGADALSGIDALSGLGGTSGLSPQALTSAADIGFGASGAYTAPYGIVSASGASPAALASAADIGFGAPGASGGAASGGSLAAGVGVPAAIAAAYLFGSNQMDKSRSLNRGAFYSYDDGNLADRQIKDIQDRDADVMGDYIGGLLSGAYDASGLSGGYSGDIGHMQARIDAGDSPWIVRDAGGDEYGRYAGGDEAIKAFLEMNQGAGNLSGDMNAAALDAYFANAYDPTGLATAISNEYAPDYENILMGAGLDGGQIDGTPDIHSLSYLGDAFSAPDDPFWDAARDPIEAYDYFDVDMADSGFAQQQYSPISGLLREVGEYSDPHIDNPINEDKALYLLNSFDPGP